MVRQGTQPDEPRTIDAYLFATDVLALNPVSNAVLIFIKNPMAKAHRIFTSTQDRATSRHSPHGAFFCK